MVYNEAGVDASSLHLADILKFPHRCLARSLKDTHNRHQSITYLGRGTDKDIAQAILMRHHEHVGLSLAKTTCIL